MVANIFEILDRDTKLVLLAGLRFHPEEFTEDMIRDYINNNKLYLLTEDEIEDRILTSYGRIKEDFKEK